MLIVYRSRMHTKKSIDNLVHKALFWKCTVPLERLSGEDIERIKL